MQGDYNVSDFLLIKIISRNSSYILQAAVAALNTLQSNFSIVDAIRKSGRGMNKQAIPEMIEWCRRIGYEVCVVVLFLFYCHECSLQNHGIALRL